MYESLQLALSVLTSSAHCNLGLFYQHSVMGRSSVPHQGQRLPWYFWWLLLFRFWVPDKECLYSRRKLPLYADEEISCGRIQAFTFLVSNSYGLH